MQSSHYPGLNDENDYQWLTERNVLAQAKALARTLKPYGYDHVNIDAGWWSDFTWKPGYDAHGRQTPNAQRFPRGMAPVAADVHRLGLKAGIYLPVGLEKPAYDDGDYPIAGAPGCSTHDIVYSDKRTTNGWDNVQDRLREAVRAEVRRQPGRRDRRVGLRPAEARRRRTRLGQER
ncbi:hypothetical protein GCM10025868_27160 [Angustibacter aerolatus]|uniref:Alpha-galactosidase n=1 Tax=Angustibacter aerolatus TaxID=1162965 RepID=A0ABQ6JIU2_9ACTN|nr:hypothetical protein [Angustibacter aerolatus]GMA87466.1 hypothetical protein GCM10025868_27160 [Angustibacter aerolatus]